MKSYPVFVASLKMSYCTFFFRSKNLESVEPGAHDPWAPDLSVRTPEPETLDMSFLCIFFYKYLIRVPLKKQND